MYCDTQIHPEKCDLLASSGIYSLIEPQVRIFSPPPELTHAWTDLSH